MQGEEGEEHNKGKRVGSGNAPRRATAGGGSGRRVVAAVTRDASTTGHARRRRDLPTAKALTSWRSAPSRDESSTFSAQTCSSRHFLPPAALDGAVRNG